MDEKLLNTLIDYGYLQRQIDELMIFSYDPEKDCIPQFEDERLSAIYNSIKNLHGKVQELKSVIITKD